MEEMNAYRTPAEVEPVNDFDDWKRKYENERAEAQKLAEQMRDASKTIMDLNMRLTCGHTEQKELERLRRESSEWTKVTAQLRSENTNLRSLLDRLGTKLDTLTSAVHDLQDRLDNEPDEPEEDEDDVDEETVRKLAKLLRSVK